MNKKVIMNIKGMMCAGCAANVEKVVKRLPCVEEVTVSLVNEKMTVILKNGSREEIENVISAVDGAGFEAFLPEEDSPEDEGEDDRKKTKVTLAIKIVCAFVVLMLSLLSGKLPLKDSVRCLSEVVAVIPVIICSLDFYKKGFPSLFKGHPGMDSLIAVSTTSVFLYSAYAMVTCEWSLVCLESGAMILAIVSLGRYLEENAKYKAGENIRRLGQDSEPTANLITENGERVIPGSEICENDRFLVKPGQQFPADAVIQQGTGTVDESMLTGEAMPVLKAAGDLVYGGSYNGSSSLVCIAIRSGKDTALTRIINLVDEARSTKAPVARIADKIAGVFVPVVMLIALVSGLLWLIGGAGFSFSLMIFVSVLSVSCPCAMGLATPMAVSVGIGRGAKEGVIFRSGGALEKTASVNKIIFDKTGTLTTGNPSVAGVYPEDEISADDLLFLAASAEKGDNHPLGRAIVNEASDKGIELTYWKDLKTMSGMGISCYIQDKFIECISPGCAIKQQYDFKEHEKLMREQESCGNTVILIFREHIYAGCIALSDTVKEDAPQLINAIKTAGIEVSLVTGDSIRVAQSVGCNLGIDDVTGGVLPSEKLDTVNRLREKGKIVAMVGDGMNDAPSLAAADLGIAMETGSDIAISQGDIIVMNGSLKKLGNALRLSKQCMKIIHQNLFWAFLYNILMIPVAAGAGAILGGFTLNPIIAAAAMSVSSIIVVLNSIRLNRIDLDKK